MLIPAFEMLSLLPDGETFLAAESYHYGKRRRLLRKAFSLEQVNQLAESHRVVLIVKRKGFGYAARFGHTYLKLDYRRIQKAGYVADKV